jgi:hypothetical protein
MRGSRCGRQPAALTFHELAGGIVAAGWWWHEAMKRVIVGFFHAESMKSTKQSMAAESYGMQRMS